MFNSNEAGGSGPFYIDLQNTLNESLHWTANKTNLTEFSDSIETKIIEMLDDRKNIPFCTDSPTSKVWILNSPMTNVRYSLSSSYFSEESTVTPEKQNEVAKATVESMSMYVEGLEFTGFSGISVHSLETRVEKYGNKIMINILYLVNWIQ